MSFINFLARLQKIESAIQNLLNRTHPIQIAIVTDNKDPSGQRMIRVSRQIQANRSQSYWIQAGRSSSYSDEPLPKIGDTVLIALSEGDAHDGYLLRTLANATNPPDTEQKNPIKDNTIEIPGDEKQTIGGNQSLNVSGNKIEVVDGKLEIKVNGGQISIDSVLGRMDLTALDSITLKNDAGASLVLLEDGSVLITDKFGKTLNWGGGNGTIYDWNLGGSNFNFTNVGKVYIEGIEVAVVGAKDTRNDTLTTSGQ
jgi:hypothetical protein